MKIKSRKISRKFYALTLAVILVVSVVQPFTSTVFANNADGPAISTNVQEAVYDRQLWLYLVSCINAAQFYVTASELQSGNLIGPNNPDYDDKNIRGGMFVYDTRDCNYNASENGPGEFLNRMGVTDFIDFFCGLPSVYNDRTGGLGDGGEAGGTTKQACKNGTRLPESHYLSNGLNDLESLIPDIKNALNNKPRAKAAFDKIKPYERYVQLWLTFARGCSEAVLTNPYPTDGSDPAGSNGSIFKIPIVNDNGKVRYFVADTGGVSIDGKQVPLAEEYMSPDGYSYPQLVTCGRLAEGMRETADAYARYVQAHPNEDYENTVRPDNTPPDANEDEDANSCDLSGVGWIVCPVLEFMGKLNDTAFSLIAKFLTVEPRLLNEPDTFTAWRNFRDLANALFVIAFLIIIYSQITSAGLSNYGIKKMLPRLIIAAILVNVSFILCQLAVDLSNIIGSSIYRFLKDVPTSNALTGDAGIPSWVEVTGVILAGAAALIAMLLLLVSIGTATLLAVAMALLILIARKAILLLLVVVSPVAFVAYLLPNTEDWFKKWWKLFSSLLLVFPVVGLIFGASTLAAKILNNAGGNSTGNNDALLLQLTALGVMAVPLFAVPIVLKGALAATGALGGKLGSLQDKANTAAVNRAKGGRLGEAKAAYDARKQHNKVTARLGKGGRMTRVGNVLERRGGRLGGVVGGALRRGDVSKLGAKFDESKAGQYLGGDRGQANAKYEFNKHMADEVGRQETLLSDKPNAGPGGLHERLTDESGKYSHEMKIAAAKRIMETGTHEERLKALDYMADAAHRGVHGIDDVQQFSADAIAKQGYTGVGESGYKELKEGTFGKDGRTVGERASARVNAGKISAQGLSKLTGADITHTTFDASAKAKLKATLADADADPQTQRMITDEVRNAINSL